MQHSTHTPHQHSSNGSPGSQARQAVNITVSRKLALLLASTAILHAMLRRDASVEVALEEPISRSPGELARRAVMHARQLLEAADEELTA